MTCTNELAREAVRYAWPLYEMRRMRASASFSFIEGVGHTGDESRWSNVFWHRRELIRPGDTPIVTPNTDTLYSTVWLDLRAGPLVMDVPDTAGRYYVLGFLDFYTNPFAHIGQRTTGTGAGSFFVTGPGWCGEPPVEFHRPHGHVACATPWVRVIARIMVNGEDDLGAAHAVQNGLRIRSFDGAAVPGRFDPGCDHRHPADATHFATQVNAALLDCPPPAEEGDIVARFAEVGIGAGVVPDADQLRTLQAAIEQVAAELRAPAQDGSVSGWEFMPEISSSYGHSHALRAQVAVRYLGMLETREAVYPMAWYDSEGNALDGRRAYVLRFPPGQLPPADAFWSLTMYSAETMNLVENAAGRYAIGDRTPGLMPDVDGGLTITIQKDPPRAPGRLANWLPSPASRFYLCLRAYLPKPELLDGSYRIPAITRLLD